MAFNIQRLITGIVATVGALLLLMALSASPAWAQELSVDKTGPDTVANGGQITYTIVVSNTGDAAATDVTLTDDVPAGTQFESVSPDTCSEASGTVTCEFAEIPSGESETVTLVVSEDGTQDTITNTATATSVEDEEGDSGSATTTVGSASGGDGGNGSDQYRIEITNIINIPGKDLPETGGPPLLAILFSVVAGGGLLTAILRRRY